MTKPPRPVSGAVCPNCGKEDTIFLESGDAGDFRHCRACDFREKRPESGTPDQAGEWSPVKVPD